MDDVLNIGISKSHAGGQMTENRRQIKVTHPLLCGAKLIMVRDDLCSAWKPLKVEWSDGSFSGAWRELLSFVGLVLVNIWNPKLKVVENI